MCQKFTCEAVVTRTFFLNFHTSTGVFLYKLGCAWRYANLERASKRRTRDSRKTWKSEVVELLKEMVVSGHPLLDEPEQMILI